MHVFEAIVPLFDDIPLISILLIGVMRLDDFRLCIEMDPDAKEISAKTRLGSMY
jgi:hypothetical protein